MPRLCHRQRIFDGGASSGSSAGPSAPLDEVFGQLPRWCAAATPKRPAAISAIWARRCQHTKTTLNCAGAAFHGGNRRAHHRDAHGTSGSIGCSRSSANIRCQRTRRFPSLLPVLLSATLEASRAIAAYRDEANLAFAQQLRDYIAAHFSDPQLSISVLCDVTPHQPDAALARVPPRSGHDLLQYVLDMRTTGRGTCCCTATKGL